MESRPICADQISRGEMILLVQPVYKALIHPEDSSTSLRFDLEDCMAMKTLVRRLTAAAIAASALFYTASAFALPLALSGRGSGTETGSAGSCNNPATNACTGTNCNCYEFTGTGSVNSGVGNVNITTQFVQNLSSLVDNLACESATGTLLMAQKSKPSNVLALDYQGLVCLATTQFVFNGSYAVNGTASLGKFAGAIGSGTFTASIPSTGTSTITLGDINGTLMLN